MIVHGLTVFIISLLILGCSIDGRLRNMGNASITLDAPLREYQLRTGDQLSLFYSIKRGNDSTAYVLEPGDQIRLVVSDREDISLLYTIAPDGMLYLPAAEPIGAAGKTARDVESLIRTSLKHLTVNATVLISFERFNTRSLEIISALSPQNGRGPVFQAVVGADSAILLPVVGRVLCTGKTYAKLVDTVEMLYKKCFSALQVIPLSENSSMNVVTVLGEVQRPGAFPVSGRVTLSTALGLAGGWMKSASLNTIVIVQRNGARLSVSSIDFERDLFMVSQLALSAGDVVFVPEKPITDVNVFIDEYIRKNLPVGVGVTIPLTF
jgi:polysaccharide export outer membrane protein